MNNIVDLKNRKDSFRLLSNAHVILKSLKDNEMTVKTRVLLLVVFVGWMGSAECQTTGDYRTAANTAWSVLSAWQRWNGASWVV